MAERPSSFMTESEVRERYGGAAHKENIQIKKESGPINDEHENVFTDYDLFEGYPPGVKKPTDEKEIRNILQSMVQTFKRLHFDPKLFLSELNLNANELTDDPEFSTVVDRVAIGGEERLTTFYVALRKHASKESNYHEIAETLQNKVRMFGKDLLSSKKSGDGNQVPWMLGVAFLIVFAVLLLNYTQVSSSWFAADNAKTKSGVNTVSEALTSLDSSPTDSLHSPQSSQQSESSDHEPSTESTSSEEPSPDPSRKLASSVHSSASQTPKPLADCVIKGGLDHAILSEEINSPHSGFGDVKVKLCLRLGNDWHPMANRLSLRDYVISEINDKCSRRKLYECCMEVLSMWSKQEPSATWAKLILSFKDSNCDLANDVVTWLKKQ